MEEITERLSKGYERFSQTIISLLSAVAVPLSEANPPEISGVYILLVEGKVMYVGEAKGSSGLRDRLLRKHLSGDDNHAIQRAFKTEFPDRLLRREHIKNTVHAKWITIHEKETVSIVERLLIWLLRPAWNRT